MRRAFQLMLLFLLTNYVVNRYAILKFQTRPMQEGNQSPLKTAKEKSLMQDIAKSVCGYWQVRTCSVLQKKTVM